MVVVSHSAALGRALTVVGLIRSTWRYLRDPGAKSEPLVYQRDRRDANCIFGVDRVQVEALINTGWKADNSADHFFAAPWRTGR